MNAIVQGPLEGEILAPGDTINVVAVPHPLKFDRRVFELPAGMSIAEIVNHVSAECAVSRLVRGAEVTIDGHVIPRQNWKTVRVKAGRHVLVRALAGKGGGNIFRSILTIALTVLATWVVGPAGLGVAAAVGGGAIGAIAASAVAGGIMLGGGLLLNALFPPSQTKSQDASQSYSIAAQQNTAAKWGPIPSQLGRNRVNPKYAARPYTEFVGDEQYLRMLFVWGYGPMNIDAIKIGDTAIGSYQDVEIQTYQGYADDPQQTLYPSEVIQTDLNIEPAQNVPAIQTSAEDAAEIVLDFVASQGLVKIDDKGRYNPRSVDFQIDMSPAGQNSWTSKGTVTLTGSKSNDPIRRSFRFVMGGGEWDVRVTRLTDDEAGSKIFDTVVWTALKTFRTAPAISFGKPLAITALRIRATKQLNGTIDNLSGLVTTIANSWNGTEWVPAQQTRNPGDLMRLVLQGPANARPRTDGQIDLASFAAFADHCRANGFNFDMYRDFTASVRDTLKDIAAAGRGMPTFTDGKWAVVWEESDAPVIQHFTPRNSRDFTWTQQYRVFPHGLRCRFVNADRDYIEDEILVFDDGYTKETATLYEQAEFPGVTDPAIITKLARYQMAAAKARPATYTVTTDFEHLRAQRTDRIAVGHDVIMQGLASGRIKAIDGQQLTIDEPAPMDAGGLYGIFIRRNDGSAIVLQVTTDAGLQDVVTVAGDTSSLAEGNLYTFGIRDQETGTFRILAIRPENGLTAEIDLVDDGPNVLSGDTGDTPPSTRPTPNPMANYTPTGLKAASAIVPVQLGQIYRTTLYWNAVGGPAYSSFEIVGTGPDGRVVDHVEGPDARSTFFDDLASGQWSFVVRAFFTDGTYTPFSAALIVPVNVPDGQVGVGSINILDDAVNQRHLAQTVKQIQAFFGKDLDALWQTVGELAGSQADQDNANWIDKQQIYEAITATSGVATAKFERQINAAAGPGSAIVTDLTSLKAQIADAIATAAQLFETDVSTLSGVVTATSNAITQLSGTVGDVSASLTIRGEVQASQYGGDVEWGIQLKETNGSWSKIGNVVYSLKGGVFSEYHDADEFILASGGNLTKVAEFVNGTWYTAGLVATNIQVTSATSGARVQILNTGLTVYDDNNIDRVVIGKLS